MGSYSYQVLLVGEIPLDDFFGHQAATQPANCQVTFTRVSTYHTAIQFVKYGRWDAILVARDFDSHSGLEFIHHARLICSETPLILLCAAYDDDLDYKARRIGAADLVTIHMVNLPYLHSLFTQRSNSTPQNRKRPNRPFLQKWVEGFLSIL